MWQIDQPLVLDYLECGGSVNDLSRFLAENAAEEIPGRVRKLFDDLQVATDDRMDPEKFLEHRPASVRLGAAPLFILAIQQGGGIVGALALNTVRERGRRASNF